MKAFELGGQEIVTKTLAEYFSQKEHNVVIVSFLQPNKLMVERIIQRYRLVLFMRIF